MLSIIVPTVNRGEILRDTYLHLVKAIEGLEVEIVLVNDNKQTPIDTGFYQHPKLVIVNNPGKGAASARNTGVRQAKGDLLLFIDDDILVRADNLQRTLELHATNKNVAYNFNWVYPSGIMDALQHTQFGRFSIANHLTDYKGWVQDVNWAHGGMIPVHKLAAFYMSMERRLFEQVGGFNESFSNQGIEDDELSLRLETACCHMFIDTSQMVYHNEKDRQELEARLKRIQAAARNRRVAFELGMKNYELHYSPLKKIAYTVLGFLKPLLLGFVKMIPNRSAFDKIYASFAHKLIGTVIFQGYLKNKT